MTNFDEIFKQNNVFLAHCLSNNTGGGNPDCIKGNIYDKIKYIYKKKPELSCSTIKPTDYIEHQKSFNFYGPIGLILEKINITYANYRDGGTRVIKCNFRDYEINEETMPTLNNVTNAIKKRDKRQYNELCVNKYQVYGLFLCVDDMIFLKQSIGNEEKFYNNTKDLTSNYFFLKKGILLPIKYNCKNKCFENNGIAISINDIYKNDND